MSKVIGRAKRFDGTAIDYVSVFNWTDGKCLARLKPNSAGKWQYSIYKDINIGVTYVADGCEPISHGPYSFLSSWNPLALFANTEKGVFYNPSDLSTLFQDAAGTTPVTADGQPVGLIKDLSGNNYHASQSALNSRPIYKTDGELHWLYFDGIDDHLVSEYSLQSRQHLMAISFELLKTSAQQGLIECFGDKEGDPDFKKGSRLLYSSNNLYYQQGDGTTRFATAVAASLGKRVLTGRLNNRNVALGDNGTTTTNTNAGDMAYAAKTYIGSNNGITKTPAKMNFYGALVLARNATNDELSKAKTYLSDMAGITA